ncbi:hypothetical protein HN958_02540 [Candidatus Falkowbacteria bacterium]|jgi:hypothetical protein|nr:hypothetical protein [Candidatus Falkowbacteria bacterium]MBT7007360.1 hypothetical protein [Candidatus Falkowbacteria bacterium]
MSLKRWSNSDNGQSGLGILEVIAILAILGVLSLVAVLSIQVIQEKARDVKRVSDMNTLSTSYNKIIFEYDDYTKSGCTLGHMHACSGNLEMMKILPVIGEIKDPVYHNDIELCSYDLCRQDVSVCDYALVEQDDGYYEVLFNLEHGIEDFEEKGCYKLTPIGIQKIELN